MRTQFTKFALTAGILLALAFTFGCSGSDDNQGGNNGGSGTNDLCGGVSYDQSIYRCESGELIGKCRGQDYYVAYEQCVNGVVVDNCKDFVDGTPREHYGKSKAQFCDSRDGQKYVYIKIGTQTWMAENLNYAAGSSKCLGEDGRISIKGNSTPTILSPDEIQANCEKYGKLYDWVTAMVLPDSCNSSFCASQIGTKHRGVCPLGWHIPSKADWNALTKFIDPNCLEQYCENAGTKLKATSDWDSNDGQDTYGFSALPGGSGSYDGGSYYHYSTICHGCEGGVKESNFGTWQSATEYNESNFAYIWQVYNAAADKYWSSAYKTYMYSVRCLKD